MWLFLFFRLKIVFQGFYLKFEKKIYLRKNMIAKKVFLSISYYGKSSMFCHFRKLENLKIFIGNNIKGYNETSLCSNLVHFLKFERNVT